MHDDKLSCRLSFTYSQSKEPVLLAAHAVGCNSANAKLPTIVSTNFDHFVKKAEQTKHI